MNRLIRLLIQILLICICFVPFVLGFTWRILASGFRFGSYVAGDILNKY